MGVRILHDRDHNQAVLTCSTTDWAFGPVVGEREGVDADPSERLEAFLEWLKVDPRAFSESYLATKYSAWLAQELDQIALGRLADLDTDERDGVLLDHEVAELAALRARFVEAVR
jgi:hypothetical protein